MNERDLVRDLARQVYEFAVSDESNKRRDLWRDHNSLKRTRPMVIATNSGLPTKEVPELQNLVCSDPLMRNLEHYFRHQLYHISLNDDMIFEPWYRVAPVFDWPVNGNVRWGPEISVNRTEQKGGSFIFDPPLKTEEDLAKLVKPVHKINERKTAERYERICEVLGGSMPAAVSRSPYYKMWQSDIAHDLAYLRGLEQMMWDMAESPELLKKITGFLSEGALHVQDAAEANGDWSLVDHNNQSVTYSRELPDPAGDGQPVTRDKLWVFCAAQEAAVISPDMWAEFILAYQKPIYEKFGLLAYGCCEDLTHKIPVLKRELPNLRRIAVTPWADWRSCAEQIGSDYVYSWRPSPADMVSCDFDPERVKKTVREAFKLASEHKNHIDVTLKDVQTVSGNLDAVPGFMRCVREVIDEGGWEWR